MSVDLSLEPVRQISLRAAVPKIAAAFTELLNLTTAPTLTLSQSENGRVFPAVDDEMGIEGRQFFYVSIDGEPERVTLLGDAHHITISISGGPRSDLGYALGAAIAIALGRELGTELSDDRRFYSARLSTTPDLLLRELKVPGPNGDYRTAASKIRWGPGGQE